MKFTTSSQGIRLFTNSQIAGVGVTVSQAGDVNGDGFDDVLVQDANSESFLVLGRSENMQDLLLTPDDSEGVFLISGAASNSLSEKPVTGIGDINNDGYDDLMLADSEVDGDGFDQGGWHIIFGSASLDHLSAIVPVGYPSDSDILI